MTEEPTRVDELAGEGAPDRVRELLGLFPEVASDGKVDLDKLRVLLGVDDVETGPERYGLTWPGKKDAMRLAQKQSTGTLNPMPEESVSWDTTKNVIVEGDNLEVLKLLQKSYYGQVKLIYIDPPYNTGNDFVYKDDFAEPTESYLRRSGQVDGQGFRTTTNRETSGRYHSDWLNMMYPRLAVARRLLSDEGIMFISINDREFHNLRLVVDEIFGSENFIAQIAHKSRASVSSDKILSENHTSILLVAKNKRTVESRRAEFGLEPRLEGFALGDPSDPYKLVPVDGPGGAKKGNPFYEFLGVEGYWRFSRQTMQSMHERGLIVRTASGLQQKYFRREAMAGRRTDTTWWDDGGLNASATKYLDKLMDGRYFDNPKPVELIRRMLQLWVRRPDELVVDFFGGSGTTAEAVIRQNFEDGVNRRFLLIQLDEESAHPRFPTIADITRERVRRAGTKIVAEHPDEDLDVGFRAFKLSGSNFTTWESDKDEIFGEDLDLFVDNLKADATDEQIVHEILLKAGVRLDAELQRRTIAGETVHLAEGGAVVVSAARRVTGELIDGLVALDPPPLRVILLDSAFGDDDSLKINAQHRFAARLSEDDPNRDSVFRTV